MQSPMVILFLFILSACGGKDNQNIPHTKADSVLYYPYSPVYTSAYEPGRDVYGKTVLEVWRQFETGDVMRSSDSFADSVTMIFNDEIVKGSKDAVLKHFRERRNKYPQVQAYIDSWMSVRARDAGEDIVLLWGRQDCTRKDGKRDYLVLHEIWRFDTRGRIRRLDQYITHPH